MQAPNDWRDVEITGYMKLNGAHGEDNFAWYGRGGKHTDKQTCWGTAYKGDVYYSGNAALG